MFNLSLTHYTSFSLMATYIFGSKNHSSLWFLNGQPLHIESISISRLQALPKAPLGSAWLAGSWPPLLPSPDIILACPLSPSSSLPSSFLNLCSLVLHLRFVAQHFLSPPLFLITFPYSLLHSRSTHLFFTFCFLLFTPLILSANGVVFFFSCIDLGVCLTFVCY
jgi:hypothetical protein